MDKKEYKIKWGGRDLVLTVGGLAELTDGTVRVQYGETTILATAVISSHIREGIDYFPLLVDYREHYYAAGKIKGSRWIKREGRPTDDAVLTGRLIDRSLRPLFPKGIKNDVQVVCNVLTVDGENTPDFLALIAGAASLMISSIPWTGPLAACRMGMIDGKLVLNPTHEQLKESTFSTLIAANGDEVVMIEAEGNEASEDEAYKAIEQSVEEMKPVIKLLEKIQKEVGVEKIMPAAAVKTDEQVALETTLLERAVSYVEANVEKAIGLDSKAARDAAWDELEHAFKQELIDDEKVEDTDVKVGMAMYEQALEQMVRRLILEDNRRVDGRAIDEVRPISSEVDILPRTHGTGLFQRGETQVLSIVTLGGPGMEQEFDDMEKEGSKRYFHHYNFPGFSVGEVSPFRGAGRREIGHGALAEKALTPVLPEKEDFPYTIQVVSEVLASNGSTSQASACGSSLALMAAGVPITKPVAGIAMGLVTSDDLKTFKVLTDIQGVEDHSGDMDFKVAGTKDGITAIQVDIKLDSISLDVCKEALVGAKAARLGILDVMTAAIDAPRAELSEYAPRIKTIKIDPEKIGDIIGPGGKIIRAITEETGVEIDIEDDGSVFITSVDEEGMNAALDRIENLVREIEVGEEFEGTVVKILKDRFKGNEIGAIVELLPGGADGMVHISEFRWERIEKVSDLVKEGDKLKVKVTEIDKERGKIGLSVKALLPKPEGYEERPPRRDPRGGGSRGGSRGRDSRPARR